jgi:SAM-dependent methyltransferase
MGILMGELTYSTEFFEQMGQTSRPSATLVVEWLIGLARPDSVLDVGCGEGAWTASFSNASVADVLGMDGDYVDRRRLLMPQDRFCAKDLSAPIDLGRRFDLAVCLEVAEHLSPGGGDELVATLCKHADVLLFSAAIPGQTGTGHINEQWPAYWIERLNGQGYDMFDVVRPRFWDDAQIGYWYKQNAMFFIRRGTSAFAARMRTAVAGLEHFRGRALVHPECWDFVTSRGVGHEVGPSVLLSRLPAAMAQAVRRRLK